jgi:mono/diheme cytochrome c family protein
MMTARGFITLVAIALVAALSLIPSPKGQAQRTVQEEKPGLQEPSPVLPEERQLIDSLDGRLLFRAYCASCHGTDAKGNGPAAPSLKTAPADLTRISQRNGGSFPLLKVQRTISGENAGTAAHGSREMPVWGPIFGQIAWDQDLGQVRIYNLAKYLESLQKQ